MVFSLARAFNAIDTLLWHVCVYCISAVSSFSKDPPRLCLSVCLGAAKELFDYKANVVPDPRKPPTLGAAVVRQGVLQPISAYFASGRLLSRPKLTSWPGARRNALS